MDARETIAEVVRRDHEWVTNTELADAILAALRAAGFAVVPVEPTEAMLVAATKRDKDALDADHPYGMYSGIYRAMLAAAAKDGS